MRCASTSLRSTVPCVCLCTYTCVWYDSVCGVVRARVYGVSVHVFVCMDLYVYVRVYEVSARVRVCRCGLVCTV